MAVPGETVVDHRAIVAALFRVGGIVVGVVGASVLGGLVVTFLLTLFMPAASPIPPDAGFFGSIIYAIANIPFYIFDFIRTLLRDIALWFSLFAAVVVAVGGLLFVTGRGLAQAAMPARVAAIAVLALVLVVGLALGVDSVAHRDWGEAVAALVVGALPLYPLWVLILRFDAPGAARIVR
jgi:hypothetical protein